MIVENGLKPWDAHVARLYTILNGYLNNLLCFNLLITAYGSTKMRSYDFIKDYSFYQIPIIRCLEYFLKFIFNNYGIRFQAKKDRKAYIYNNFRMFKRYAKLNEYILYEKMQVKN